MEVLRNFKMRFRKNCVYFPCNRQFCTILKSIFAKIYFLTKNPWKKYFGVFTKFPMQLRKFSVQKWSSDYVLFTSRTFHCDF